MNNHVDVCDSTTVRERMARVDGRRMTAENAKHFAVHHIHGLFYNRVCARMFERYRRILLLALVVLARVSESLKYGYYYDIITTIHLSPSRSESAFLFECFRRFIERFPKLESL